MQYRRPVAVDNYLRSSVITHHFDRAARAEYIRGALALPVVVRSQLCAVIYGASRTTDTLGERTITTASALTRRLAYHIDMKLAVRHRLQKIQQKTNRLDRATLSDRERTESTPN